MYYTVQTLLPVGSNAYAHSFIDLPGLLRSKCAYITERYSGTTTVNRYTGGLSVLHKL